MDQKKSLICVLYKSEFVTYKLHFQVFAKAFEIFISHFLSFFLIGQWEEEPI